MALMFEHMEHARASTTECDTKAMLRFVDTQPQADARCIGAVGYCMSGPFVMWAAAAFPDRLRCIASIHGANMATDKPDSPHRVAAQIRCEATSPAPKSTSGRRRPTSRRCRRALQAAGMPHRIEWYPGAEHGFVFPLRAGIYDKPAAERHWERLFSLFDRNLRKAD